MAGADMSELLSYEVSEFVNRAYMKVQARFH